MFQLQPLTPLQGHPEPHTYQWTKLELQAIENWGNEVRRQALKHYAQAAGRDDSFRDEWIKAKADAVARIRALPGA